MRVAGVGAVFDTLTEIAADGSLKGELAESWTSDGTAKVWTIDLRRDVRFHDGTPFEAGDVVASMKLHLGKSRSVAAPLLRQVASIRRQGKYRVAFELHAPNPDFPYLLSDPHLLIYPAARMAEAMAQGIGTGLYRIVDFSPGHRLRAERVAGHYKDGQSGWFDALDLWALDGIEARRSALRAGQIDAISGGPACGLGCGDGGITVHSVQGNAHVAFTMRTDRGPFADAGLRTALKYAVDRGAMQRDVLGGAGMIGADHPVGPLNPYQVELAVPGYDPDYARYLMQRVGFDRLDLPLGVPTGLTGFAEHYADTALGAGITIAPSDTRSDWLAVSWAGRPTEDWMLSSAFDGAAPLNSGRWSDPHLTEIIGHARSTLNPQDRAALYAEAQALIARDGNVVVPVFVPFTMASRASIIAPDTIGATHALDDARIAERWWRA